MNNAIELTVHEKYTTLKILFKECDIYYTTSLYKSFEALLPAIKTPFVAIDFSEVLYIDSSGIGLIAHIRKNLTAKGIDMVCVGMTDKVMMIFKITNTEALFKIFATLDEGVEYINENL